MLTSIEAIVRAVDGAQIGTRFCDFRSRSVVAHLGLAAKDGDVPVSMIRSNTHEETDRLVVALDRHLG